jgi:hypothetical protein
MTTIKEELEKKIEEAGHSYTNTPDYMSTTYLSKAKAFVDGANSPEAKALWQHELYTEKELQKAFNAGMAFATGSAILFEQIHPKFDQWFNLIKKKS